jgi:hypothetical protein
MSILDLAKKINAFFTEVFGASCRVLSVLPDGNSWKSVCEVIVDPEYTTRKGLGDLVEIYEVNLNEKLEVTGFTIKETKRRANIDD